MQNSNLVFYTIESIEMSFHFDLFFQTLLVCVFCMSIQIYMNIYSINRLRNSRYDGKASVVDTDDVGAQSDDSSTLTDRRIALPEWTIVAFGALTVRSSLEFLDESSLHVLVRFVGSDGGTMSGGPCLLENPMHWKFW